VPLDKLAANELRIELQAHGVNTQKLTKKQMETEFGE